MEEEKKEWNEAKDGVIDVPDYLDGMINKVGMQLRFYRYSDKNETQTICDIVHGMEKFFKKHHNQS